jgi:hypothetical protein
MLGFPVAYNSRGSEPRVDETTARLWTKATTMVKSRPRLWEDLGSKANKLCQKQIPKFSFFFF